MLASCNQELCLLLSPQVLVLCLPCSGIKLPYLISPQALPTTFLGDSGLASFSVCDLWVTPLCRLFRFTEDRLAASDAHGNVMAYELTDTPDEIVTEQLFSLRLGSLTGAQHVCLYVCIFFVQSALCAPGLQIRYKLGLLYGSSRITTSRCKL